MPIFFRLFVIFIFTPFLLPAQNAWLDDWQTAQQMAEARQRPILLVFSGSDWCRPCMKLEQEVWDNLSFQDFASDQLILLRADFPRSRRNRLSDVQMTKNEQLAERFNPQGVFPKILLLTSDGKRIDEWGYLAGGAKNYLRFIKSALKG
jgi:thioredoxin-related protein